MGDLPTPPYTEATIELVAAAVAEATLAPAIGGTRRHAALVLDALVKAGLLLPEGADTQYAAGIAAGRARAAADIRDHPGPDPSPASPTWWAGYSEALRDAARLAEGDSSKGSDFEGGGEADLSKRKGDQR